MPSNDATANPYMSFCARVRESSDWKKRYSHMLVPEQGRVLGRMYRSGNASGSSKKQAAQARKQTRVEAMKKAWAERARKAKDEQEKRKRRHEEIKDNLPADFWEKRKEQMVEEQKRTAEQRRRNQQEWEDAERMREFRERERVLAIRRKIRDSPSTLDTCDEFQEFCKMNKHYSGVEDVHGHGSGNKRCFKALALKVHPDKGGTTKGMRALNDCNLWLRAPDD